MQLFSSLFTLGLLTTTLAAPQPRRQFPSYVERRSARSRTRGGGPRGVKESGISNTTETATTETISYSSNWAGLVYDAPPSGKFNAVSATFTVQKPSKPAGVTSSTGEYGSSAWVGIDGATCSSAILQTGVDMMIGSDGEVTYDAWYGKSARFPTHTPDIKVRH